MEVHHHPTVEKKKFKEYFFEFIMIFLASQTKYRIVRLLIYILVGFAAAFLWRQMRK